MRKSGILNAEICREIAALGHTEYLAVADSGLPIPGNVKVIDISLKRGTPGFMEVLEAVAGEMVIDSYLVAEEMKDNNLELLDKTRALLFGIAAKEVSHEELKKRLKGVKAIIRTGECTPYANILIEGGVNF